MAVGWNQFRESFINDEHRVLGRRLKPYCLYYQFWLKSIDSPFLNPGRSVTVADLELAVRVCSSPYGEAPLKLPTRLGLRGHLLWWWRCWKYDFEEERERFQDYVDDLYDPPEVKSTGDKKVINKGASGEVLPQELSLAASLIEATRWSEERVWTMPLGKAHWYAAAFAVLKDPEFKLVTQEDRDHMAMIKKLQAQGLLPSDNG